MSSDKKSLSTYYLIVYNTACMIGWFYLWIVQYQCFLAGGSDYWNKVAIVLKWVQTAAILEIVHSILGIVHSPVMTTTLQVFSRVILLWGYANISTQAQQSWTIKLMVLSWSLVEVPRYAFYLIKLLNLEMPSLLLFLRYNLFILLYPTGITGEILVILNTLQFIKHSGVFSIRLPNVWNCAFDYYWFSIVLLLIYIPVGPFMFNNMMLQRKKNWMNMRQKKVD